LLIIPNLAGIAKFAGLSPDAPSPVLLSHEKLRQRLRDDLAAYNTQNPASSTRIARVLLLTEPLNIDAGEITDKGYVNQRAVLERRHALVKQLYSDSAEVILIDEGKDEQLTTSAM
jgi:feruloyl-CoA synthase